MNQITKIPKFRRCVLQNFPFIEQDFDALTDYGLLCKVVEYLNKTIDSQNSLTEDFVTLTTLFNTLKEYVDNYFDNLDIQEEVNNKLEEMAEDGTLESIITVYLRENIATITDGYTLDTIGAIGYNTQTGAYYEITDTIDHSHVQHEVATGKYATIIEGAYLNQADKTVAPMSQALVSRLAHNAASYITRRNNFVYGGTYSAFRPNVAQVGGKWEINCSTFAVLMMYGIDYEHSEYNLGTGNYVVDGRFCEDSGILEYFSTPFEGATGDHRWKYTYHLAAYMYERGYCFEPNEDLSNIRPGDVLFFKHQINGGENTTSTFREIDHSAIFGWWASDSSCVVFDVGNLPSAGLNLITNLQENLVLVGRMATQATNDDFEIISYQQDAVTTNTTTLTNVRCRNFEADEFYTLVAKIANSETNLDHYPVIYQGEDRLYGYDGATTKPENDIYIMPFLPSDLDAGAIRIQMNAREGGLTTPSTTITNPIVVKGLLNSGEISGIAPRTCVTQNVQTGFSVDSRSISKGYAILTITGALAQGNNYICDILGMHKFNDILPCIGLTYTYTSGYSAQAIQYAIDFRLTTPRLVIKAPSAVTDGQFVKHSVVIPLLSVQ